MHGYPSYLGALRVNTRRILRWIWEKYVASWAVCTDTFIKKVLFTFLFFFCERHIHACKVLVITIETTITARQAASSFWYRSAATTRTSVRNSLLSPCKDSTDIIPLLISLFLECFILTLKKKLDLILQMKRTWCTILSVYFVNFIYKFYMFRTSPDPSSGGITVFMRHLVFCYSV